MLRRIAGRRAATIVWTIRSSASVRTSPYPVVHQSRKDGVRRSAASSKVAASLFKTWTAWVCPMRPVVIVRFWAPQSAVDPSFHTPHAMGQAPEDASGRHLPGPPPRVRFRPPRFSCLATRDTSALLLVALSSAQLHIAPPEPCTLDCSNERASNVALHTDCRSFR